MKKIFAIAAAALFCSSMFAQNYKLNNPTDENNRYIVLWDCDADDFAQSNDFTPGQTFTIAFDVTGSEWETLLQGTAPAGTTYIPAAHIWFDYETGSTKTKTAVDRNPGTERLMQIRDNIYGATINLAQELEANTAGNGTAAIAQGNILYAFCNLHIANYKNADMTPGDVWWQNSAQVNYGAGDCLFATKPGDGKMDAAFTGASFPQTPMFINDEAGYAAPCAAASTGIEDVKINAASKKFVENGILYVIDARGVKHSVLGAIVK